MDWCAQLIWNILITTAGTFIFAAGLLLAYKVGGIFNFAYGALLTCGAYSAYVFQKGLMLPPIGAAVLGVAVTAGIGCATEHCIFRVLRARRAPPLVLLLASLGLYVALVSTIATVFGDGSRTLRSETVTEGIGILGARMTAAEMLTVALGVGLVICLPLVLRYTRMGKAACAMASDFDLARASGIRTCRVRLCITALGSGLAGLAGVLAGFDGNIMPTMGMSALMAGIVAVVIGGGRSITGVALAAVAMGALQNLGALAMSAQWRDGATFSVLFVFLIMRSRGLLRGKVMKITL